jgi:6-phosphogluconate dehydrogenase (decarboxylating)
MQSFKKNSPRVIIMSLPHGKPIDDVIEQLEPHLNEGDICIDGANEHYQATERRQERMKKKSVAWIGMGVSGGYQASRRGPSMSPGGDKEAYEKVKPLLREWAAKDKQGRPAVEWVGPHGAGHYVKMLHNGIEQGELSVLAEAYTLLRHTLNIPNKEIKDIFAKWNESGELCDNFLVELGSLIVGFTEGDGLKDKAGIVDDIDDKVTQDIDNSEGTGVWSVAEASLRHVSALTIATAHFLRLISANKGERVKIRKMLQVPRVVEHPNAKDKERLIEQIRLAVYGSFLCSFVQGLNVRLFYSIVDFFSCLTASLADPGEGIRRVQLGRPDGQVRPDLARRMHHSQRLCRLLENSGRMLCADADIYTDIGPYPAHLRSRPEAAKSVAERKDLCRDSENLRSLERGRIAWRSDRCSHSIDQRVARVYQERSMRRSNEFRRSSAGRLRRPYVGVGLVCL